MRYGPFLRLYLLSIAIWCATAALPQQPFDLDTTFRTDIQKWYVNSIMPLADGSLLLSGEIHFQGDPIGSFRNLAKLDQYGQLEATFPEWTAGGGKLVRWEDRFYIGGHNVQRILMNGSPDPTFILMNLDPLFGSFQGGDYHVYPDGRILMSGAHSLYAEQHGFTGIHCLVWFTNTGHLDTTKQHRKCTGSLDAFHELSDGKFIGSLGNPPNSASWEGQPTGSNVIRFHADGEWDPTFQANVWWGTAYSFLPLEDGRVYAAGLFRIQGLEDTLHLVRFMPDGSLDPTFNNTIKFGTIDLIFGYGAVVSSVYQHGDHLIVLGGYELVEGESRRSICMLDSTGQLMDDVFVDAGCGNYNYNGFIHGSLAGFAPAPDGNYYVWGAYHGYNDGTTNDTSQRMVSRLHGLSVGVEEGRKDDPHLKIYPNPAKDLVTFLIDPPSMGELVVQDRQGRTVFYKKLRPQESSAIWDTTGAAQGTYTVLLRQGVDRIISGTLIIQR